VVATLVVAVVGVTGDWAIVVHRELKLGGCTLRELNLAGCNLRGIGSLIKCQSLVAGVGTEAWEMEVCTLWGWVVLGDPSTSSSKAKQSKAICQPR
jgi:hypothetical protein